MKILVTGGAGYIGSHTATHLKKNGHQVFILDNLENGYNQKACKNLPLFEADLRDKKATLEVFQKEKFDGVVHFAAFLRVGESMKKPDIYFENNVGGTVNLLNAMASTGVKHLVFSSSAAVYGDKPKTIPIPEDAEKRPASAYGETKLIMEQMLPWYEQAYGINFTALRYFNACGAALDGSNGEAHKPETHIIPLIIRAIIKQDKSFKLFGNDYPTPDGTCLRDYIHVADLAEAHLKAMLYLKDNGQSEAFNIATGQAYSNLQVIEMVEKTIGQKLEYEVVGRRPGDPAKLVADSQKAKKILQWEPKHSDLETIIKTAYQWHKAHPETLEK